MYSNSSDCQLSSFTLSDNDTTGLKIDSTTGNISVDASSEFQSTNIAV